MKPKTTTRNDDVQIGAGLGLMLGGLICAVCDRPAIGAVLFTLGIAVIDGPPEKNGKKIKK